MTGMYKCEDAVCKMPEEKRRTISEINHEMAMVLMELNNVLVDLNNTVVSNSAVVPEPAEPMSLTDAVEMNACLAKEALENAIKLKSVI